MSPHEMACRYCGEPIPKAATRCRYCEADLSKPELAALDKAQPKSGVSLWMIFAAIIAIVLVGPRMCNPTPAVEEPTVKADPLPIEQIAANATPTTVSELSEAYAANEMAAQQRFGANMLLVTGEVESIDLDLSDEPILRLSDSGAATARAYFAPQHQAATAQLIRGARVTLLCPRVSETLGTPVLRNCMITAQVTP